MSAQSPLATAEVLPEPIVRPKRRPKNEAKPKHQPRYAVILHNDDVNDRDDVVRIIRQLTSLTKQEATARMMEADESGAALLLVTHHERAELYVEQFASMGLTATCEPDA